MFIIYICSFQSSVQSSVQVQFFTIIRVQFKFSSLLSATFKTLVATRIFFYVCMYVYTCTHTHTYTQTRSLCLSLSFVFPIHARWRACNNGSKASNRAQDYDHQVTDKSIAPVIPLYQWACLCLTLKSSP